jgi:hypothetical protein
MIGEFDLTAAGDAMPTLVLDDPTERTAGRNGNGWTAKFPWPKISENGGFRRTSTDGKGNDGRIRTPEITRFATQFPGFSSARTTGLEPATTGSTVTFCENFPTSSTHVIQVCIETNPLLHWIYVAMPQ